MMRTKLFKVFKSKNHSQQGVNSSLISAKKKDENNRLSEEFSIRELA
jgi:hypothetical protein